MKSVRMILQQREQKQALLTVLVVIMGSILFFLLVSLETAQPQVRETPTEIELSFAQLESGAAPKVETSSSVKTQTQETVVMESNPVKIKGEEVKVSTDAYLGFKMSDNAKDGSNLFGSEGKDDTELNRPISVAKRTVIKGPSFQSETQEEGTIALVLWVDQNGKVVRTRLNPEASTSGSSYLIGLAKKAAATMLFDSKTGAIDACVGSFVFTFTKQ